MSRKSRSGSLARKAVTAGAATALAAAGLVSGAATASAAPYCGPSQFVKEITVSQWADHQFQIHLTPTSGARLDALVNHDKRPAVVAEWHAIQRCVPGLTGDVADSIWQQLQCHQYLSWVIAPREGSIFLTGNSYDLESWRPKLSRSFLVPREMLSECLNKLGVDPAGPLDELKGRSDLLHAFDNIA
jgi:hypothetical protein